MNMKEIAKLVCNGLDTTAVGPDGVLEISFHADEESLRNKKPTVVLWVEDGTARVVLNSCLVGDWLEQCEAYSRCCEFVHLAHLITR